MAAVLLGLVAADLLVFPLRSSEADPGNAAYARLADQGPGRVLELPIFQRGKGQFGSVYQYYTQQAPRERPTGYALAPEEAFEFTERFNRLDCGAWLPGDREELEQLGIRFIVLHDGLYRQSKTPGAWFAWEGLRDEGLGLDAGRADGLPLDARARTPLPRPGEPDRSEPLLCDGWKDGALKLDEGALWLYGEGRAELVLEPVAPTAVSVFADGRALPPQRRRGRTTVTADLSGRAGIPSSYAALPGSGCSRRAFADHRLHVGLTTWLQEAILPAATFSRGGAQCRF